MLCLTQEEDAVFCFGELTFPRYHFKLFHSPTLSTDFSSPPTALWLLFHSFHSPVASIFYVFCCSKHISPSLCISLLILIPLFFLILSFISLTLSPMRPHTPPLSFSYLGACPILPLSLALSPHHCYTTPLSLSLLSSLFS